MSAVPPPPLPGRHPGREGHRPVTGGIVKGTVFRYTATMEYEITDYVTAEEYMEMRKLMGWGEFPLEQAAEGIRHTTYLRAFRKEGALIAFLRMLWDHGYVVYLADVIVRPEYQGQGLGRALMDDAMAYIGSMLKPGHKVMVSLMAAKGKEDFYKKFGFAVRPDEGHGAGMCRWIEGTVK